jgi:phage terminase small subunit
VSLCRRNWTYYVGFVTTGKKKVKTMALTDKQMKFVDEYMVDMNATQAYLRAGYKCTEEAARVSASKLLTNPNIVAEITTRQEKLQEKTELTAEWVLNELADNHRLAKQMGDMAPSNKALELIGKHIGMFTDKVKMDVTGGMNNTVQDITGLTPDERRARIDELNRRRGNGANSAS